MRTSKIKKISLAVCLALMPISIFAAGLGKLSVSSNLGEPFKAEIELLSTTPEELETLEAMIASDDAYAAQGITRLGIHNDIKVEITNRDKAPKLVLRSNQAVSDPYLDMLIQLDWASGRLQREYTVLLDPPGYKQSINTEEFAPINAPSVEAENDVGMAGSSETQMPADVKKSTSKKQVKNNVVDTENANTEAVSEDHKTKSGDNLSRIARSMQVEGVNLDQMLVGLYDQNKGAFVDGNMNRLKVGKIIKLPSKETLTSVGKSEAHKTVQLHSSNWNVYRNGLAEAVPTAKNTQQTPQKQSESGKISQKDIHDQSSKTGEQDVVKLSAGDKHKVEKDPKKAAEAKKVAEQEDAIAHDKSLAEAQERTTAVEKQIEDMQKLLALKNKAMTDLQKKAEANNAAEKKPELPKAAEPAANATHPTEEVKSEEAKPAEVALEAPQVAEEPKVEVPKVEEPKKPAPEIKAPVVEPKPEESVSLFDTITNAVDLRILGGVLGIALLGGGWLFLRNKRRKDLDSFERGILTSGGLRANTVFGNTTGTTSVSDTSFLTDFAQSTEGSMIDTNEVDPIAEAEVYMAYGRDAQAEEILKDAISKEPKRYELHLKLLEMYAARKDTSAFEAVAGELYTTLGTDDPTWAKVAELGKSLEPENPLYAQSSVFNEVDIPVATEKVVMNDLPKAEQSAGLQPDFVVSNQVSAPEIIDVTPETASSVNFSAPNIGNVVKDEKNDVAMDVADLTADAIDEFSADNSVANTNPVAESVMDKPLSFDVDQTDLRIQQGFESAPVEDISFDTDLDLSAESQFAANQFSENQFPASQYEVTQSEMTADDLSFDLNTTDENTTSSIADAPKVAESDLKVFDLSSISLDLVDETAEVDVTPLTIDAVSSDALESVASNAVPVVAAEDNSEIEVKLNLVSAYIDMDDKEGARELLEEVLKEGNAEQMMRAQLMLDSIT